MMSGLAKVANLLGLIAAGLMSLSPAHADDADICRSGPTSAPSLAVSPVQPTAVAGKPYVLKWASEPDVDSRPSTPTYLVVATPASVRFKGTGFFALTPGSPGPFGIEFGLDSVRAIVPLHTAFSDTAGEISLLFQVAQEINLEWGVVQVDECGEVASETTGELRVDVLPGAPVLIGYDEFSSRRPDSVITPKRGTFLAMLRDNSIEVIDRDTNDIVLRTTGEKPVFSPTGRFLIVETGENNVVDIFDLVAGRHVAGFSAIEGLYWSHEDSFAYADGEMYGSMIIWGTLIDAGDGASLVSRANPALVGDGADETGSAETRDMLSPGAANPDAVYMPGSIAWSAHVSVESGAAIFLDSARYASDRGRVIDLGRSRPMLKYDDARELQAALKADFGLPQLLFRGWDSGHGITRTSSFEYVAEDEGGGRAPGGSLGATAETRNVGDGARWSTDIWYENPFRDYLKYFDFDAAPTQSITVGGPDAELAADDFDSMVRGAVPIARIPAASNFVGGESTGMLNVTTIKNLRSGQDNERLKAISDTLAPLYDHSGWPLMFDSGPHAYETLPFPDPQTPPDLNSLSTLDLADEGRDTWNWKSGTAEYWLTQTVGSNRVGHWFQFSLLRLRNGNLERADPLRGLEKDEVSISDVYLGQRGDIRGDLGSVFGEPSFVGVAAERYLLIATRPIVRLIAFDLATLRPVCSIESPADTANIAHIGLSNSKSHLFQFNKDGQVNIYQCEDGARVLGGIVADNELVVMDDAGYFDGSEDAAAYVELKIPGLPGRHVLSQFASKLRRPGLLGDVLTGRRHHELAPALAPPSLTISAPSGRVADGLEIQASSNSGLRSLEVYANGRVALRRQLEGRTGRVRLEGADLPRADYVTIVVRDVEGLASAPISMMLGLGEREVGRLFGLLVGVDRYPEIPNADLRYAAADARRMAVAASGSDLYSDVNLTVLTDKDATAEAILDRLERMVSAAKEDDTLLFSFAGHGLLDEHKRLAIALSGTDLGALDHTALEFDAVITRLAKARGRVVVLLDACHSGALATSEANDVGVRQLVTASGAGIVVLAASKGRQLSEETSALGGGRFSIAIEQSLTTNREAADRDGNGAISLLELYGAIKATVSASTNNRQIPWISRNRIHGDFDLF
jgi:hypothetical protein